jgi:cytochrome c-type biogenesis protein CcmH/NrfG
MRKSPLTYFAARMLFLLFVCWLCPVSAHSQDSGDRGTLNRGDRAEIAVAVRDASGQLLVTPASVSLYKNGAAIDQSSTSRGRAFFVPRSLGEFTVAVEAAGYKSAQKDVSLSMPILAEVDIYLQPESSSSVTVGVPGKPLLAPKAKEALVKGLQALAENKLDEAQKHVSEALKLAPGNPEVLYVQGVVYMRRSNWAKAQSVLETANQLEADQPRVLAALGMSLCNQNKYDEAIPTLEKAIKLDPSASWESQWALARAYYHGGQYDQALLLAQQAHNSSHAPNQQVELLLAQCLTAVDRYEDSARVLRDLVNINPGSPDAATARRWLDRLAGDGKIRQQ